MNLLMMLGAAIAAPFLFHELGHWAVARYRGVPLRWHFKGWRLLWEFPEGAFNTREVREIGVAGIVAEALGVLAFVAVVPFAHDQVSALWACAVYVVTTCLHIWWYAVYVDDDNDDFALIERQK